MESEQGEQSETAVAMEIILFYITLLLQIYFHISISRNQSTAVCHCVQHYLSKSSKMTCLVQQFVQVRLASLILTQVPKQMKENKK